ncbi:MaoC family dehydratase [bacterium]|nr:MaoC family dehydratase [bacterium]
MSEIRKETVRGLKAGIAFSISRTFSKKDIADFARISRDDNPIHSDESFIKSKNMKGPICHGMLVASMLTEIGGQIGWLAAGMDIQFKKPVYVGETVTCHFTITSIDEQDRATAEIRFENSNRETVIEATLTGILPSPTERKILEALMDT